MKEFHRALKPFLDGGGDALRVFKSGPASQARLAAELVRAGRDVVLVAPDASAHATLAALLDLFLPSPSDPAVPVWERPWSSLGPYRPGPPTATDWGPRWAALHGLVYGSRPRVLLLTVDNLLPFWPLDLENAWLPLTRGEEMSRELVLEQATAWGYQVGRLVEGPGQASARGDVLDLAAPGYAMPLRLEFFGDQLEDIRLFDPQTQRSKTELTEAVLLPVAPSLLAGKRLDAAREFWKRLKTTGEMSGAEEQYLLERAEQADPLIWPGLCRATPAPLEDLLPRDAVWLLSASQALRQRLSDGEEGWAQVMDQEKSAKGLHWPRRFITRPADVARKAWQGRPQVVFEDLVLGREKDGLDLAETPVREFTDLFWKPEQSQRPWTALMAGLKEWKRERRQTVLCFGSERARERFLGLAESEGLPFALDYDLRATGLFALVASLRQGMDLAWDATLLLGEDVLQPRRMGDRDRAARRKAFEGLERFDDLSDGDLLVHRDWGLCRFGGLTHLKVGPVENDYLFLQFDADDRLYLPVDRIRLVQRYKGPEGHAPSLDRLGGTRWKTTTSKARKAIEKIARELVEMYAYRRVAKGFAYGPPGELYAEFEAGFGFEETPDQAKAVQDVLADMEHEEPMDRLVCGDVGFGKTEVALRAAFRAVAENRQVAILCPTTVLAEQHFQTFTQRMEPFAARVEMLSRFVPPKRQKTVLAAAARGEVDVLIGTHRLLSKDVSLPNLGLLVLDEEQRFGVKHKERLKEFRKNVDVLALTATPIPRTLQLSMSGLRGLSLIETPPEDRKPVETALIERDQGVLAAALARELERGGQVFWVYNRIRGLEEVAEFVKKLAPNARVGMAHGQMSERLLEDTMHRFWHRELDVLVSTAIIESGLDFPNVNTLVVDQAQLFGLGQLYQLRGRVGRSDRQAYAYFVVPDVDRLPEPTRKRMRIILSLDYLGAGFKVAMEDLRLRGAGNILGEAQSGQMARVGLDLYLEMLEEEVRRIRAEERGETLEPVQGVETEMQFVFEAHIPEHYLPDDRERLRYYRRLSSAKDETRLAEIAAELADRFGPLPEEAERFLGVLGVKQAARVLGATRCDLAPGRMVLSFEGEPKVSQEEIMAWMAAQGDAARLLPPNKIELRLPAETNIPQGLDFLRRQLQTLAHENHGERDPNEAP